ncbi:hypothetical protein E5CHR_01335 [Variovorax sp. PBL-E5]|nr:hypothetical protein E5CHR_01335 [Variovorax sp. PBL-E5]
MALWALCAAAAPPSPADLAQTYRDQVEMRLDPPADEALRYGVLALEALERAGIPPAHAQYVALVDRNPNVQAIFLYWLDSGSAPLLVGASPVSTGRGGDFDHFETPLGVFEHSISNPDFRAEGTLNARGIRGYGAKGMRVFDLGWQQAERLWGHGGTSTMRLQMHATDPELLESRLGSAQSKGCIRIPASLNRLLDRFGVLDEDYLSAAAEGLPMWVLPPAQTPVEGAGRYLIVVDTGRHERPAWSPKPGATAARAATRARTAK